MHILIHQSFNIMHPKTEKMSSYFWLEYIHTSGDIQLPNPPLATGYHVSDSHFCHIFIPYCPFLFFYFIYIFIYFIYFLLFYLFIYYYSLLNEEKLHLTPFTCKDYVNFSEYVHYNIISWATLKNIFVSPCPTLFLWY